MKRTNPTQIYLSSIKKHGYTPKGLCWSSNAHQQIRFEIILDMLPTDIVDCKIGDAGCGFGDFYIYLLNNNKSIKKYIGIEVIEQISKEAQKRTGCDILHKNITKEDIPVVDYYICSGALNIMGKFDAILFISKCYKASKKGFIFNTLHGTKKSDLFNYFTKNEIKLIAKNLDAREVIFKDGYIDNDITVGFFR